MSALPSFTRFSHTPTVRGLVTQALFSTQAAGDKIVMIDGESTFEEIKVRARLARAGRVVSPLGPVSPRKLRQLSMARVVGSSAGLRAPQPHTVHLSPCSFRS